MLRLQTIKSQLLRQLSYAPLKKPKKVPSCPSMVFAADVTLATSSTSIPDVLGKLPAVILRPTAKPISPLHPARRGTALQVQVDYEAGLRGSELERSKIAILTPTMPSTPLQRWL